MTKNKKAGFTLIELMIVVSIIAIIAAIAIPKLFSARISANENGAIATLRSIASAQAQLQSSCAIDTDADGGGEYGFFGELSGVAWMRQYDPAADAPGDGADITDLLDPPILPTAFGDIVADNNGEGIVERAGYFFKMYLPDPIVGANGEVLGIAEDSAIGGSGFPGGTTVGGPYPSSDNTEIYWACYAWPVDVEKTGNRVFFIDHEGDLLQYDNRDQAYEGIATPPLYNAAFATDIDAGNVAHMGSDLGITAMGATSGDGFVWTVVGN